MLTIEALRYKTMLLWIHHLGNRKITKESNSLLMVSAANNSVSYNFMVGPVFKDYIDRSYF